jgi:hypothetical protein
VPSFQGARQFSIVPNALFGQRCQTLRVHSAAQPSTMSQPCAKWSCGWRSCLAGADADGVLAADRLGEFNEYAVLEAWVAGSIGTFVDSAIKVLPSANPSFRLRGSK